MLEIENLHVAASAASEILKGIDLDGATPARCTPSWGRTARARARSRSVLAGHPDYEVTGGAVLYNGQDLLEMEPEERAREGVFLAFQYPVEIPGVEQRLLPEGRAQRDAQAPRPSRARRDRLPDARAARR